MVTETYSAEMTTLMALVVLIRRAAGRLERAGLQDAASWTCLTDAEYRFATVGEERGLRSRKVKALAKALGKPYLPAMRKRQLAAGFDCLNGMEV